MKIIDITTKEQFDETLETVMSMATGPLSDDAIVEAFRAAATAVNDTEPVVEHAVLVTLDPDTIRTAWDVRVTLRAIVVHGKTFIKASSIYGKLDEMADDYEKETR